MAGFCMFSPWLLGLSLGIPVQLRVSKLCVPCDELATWRQVVCCLSPPLASPLTWYMTEGHLTEEKIMLNLVPINFMSKDVKFHKINTCLITHSDS